MIVALGLVVAAFIIFFKFTQPVYREIQDIRNDIASYENLIDTQRVAINQVNKLINTYESQTEFKEAISASFSSGPNLSGAIAQLNGLAGLNGMSLSSISVTKTIPKSTISEAQKTGSSKSQSIKKPINTLSFGLNLVGSYEEFKSFIGNLESNIRIFDVKNIDFSPASKSVQDIYDINMVVDTYYQ